METAFATPSYTSRNTNPCKFLHLPQKPSSSSSEISSMLPPSDRSSGEKLAWLHDDVIGRDLEFESPFGKRRVIYADTTATGRCLHFVEDYIKNNVLPFYGNTHTCDSYVGTETTRMSQEATVYIKSCLGATQNDAVFFCGSGTTAAAKRLQEMMGVAVPSPLREMVLRHVSEQERWVVFTGPYEHHSNCLSWRQSLAEVVEIGLDQYGLIDMDSLTAQLEKYRPTNRPILGSFSACSNVTGVCSDTRAIARLLHQYDAFACFDFAASGPYVDMKMRSGEMDGYDAIMLSPHKFIGGPGSPGILVMNKELYKLKSFPPSTCGGGTVDFVNGYNEEDTLYMEDIEERENAGTPPIIQKIKAALALWVKEYVGYPLIQQRETFYMERAIQRLSQNPKFWILGHTKANRHVHRQPILSFLIYSSSNASCRNPNEVKGDHNHVDRLDMWGGGESERGKPLHGAFICKLLNDLFGIQARGGCACAGPYAHKLLDITHQHSLHLRSYVQKGYMGVKPGWARISFPYYMSNEEFEFILSALEFIAAYGQRFMWLYRFNWKTSSWTFDKAALERIVLGKMGNGCSCGSILMSAMEELDRMEIKSGFEGKERNEDGIDVKVLQKCASYLKTAKQVASMLPTYSSQNNTIPSEIDPNHLLFRV
ncbi:hypothetical protein V2J09_009724 [Rumex salicifolius]